MQDLWEECYADQHRKNSPEQFRQTFCANCMNAGCKNSKGAGVSWVRRIMTQEDVLLNNPQFADPFDPRFSHLVDFQDKLREALAIEVSNRRGDWEVPTDRDIGQAAAELVGISPPGYQAPPPEKLVDDVKMTGLDGRPVEDAPKETSEDTAQSPVDTQTWKVLGNGTTWKVSLANGAWACTCPGWENLKRCKHVQKIRERVEAAAPEPPPPPAPDPVRTPVKAPENVRKMNTDQPMGGVMIGGASPPQENLDPWAPAKPEEKILPLGGKVKFKS